MTVYSAEWKNEIRLWLLLKHVRDLNLTLRVMKSLWRFLEENWGSRAQDLSRGSNLICKEKCHYGSRGLAFYLWSIKINCGIVEESFPLMSWRFPDIKLRHIILGLYGLPALQLQDSLDFPWYCNCLQMKIFLLGGREEASYDLGNKANSQSSGSKQNSEGLKKFLKPRKFPPQCHTSSHNCWWEEAVQGTPRMQLSWVVINLGCTFHTPEPSILWQVTPHPCSCKQPQ